MAAGMRRITKEDIERIQAFHRGEITLPTWISDWNAKIEDCTKRLAGAVSQKTLTPELQHHYTQSIVRMMRRKDALYDKFMQDLPHKTWDELAQERPPSREDLFNYTVMDTEDFLNHPGVSTFVLFLDEQWDGFLKKFTQACLRECDPLLEEAVALTPEVRRILEYPQESFNTTTTNKDVLETRMTEWIDKTIPKGAPGYVERLLIANLQAGIGNEQPALRNMEFARAEAAEPRFAQMIQNRDPAGDIHLTQSQYWQIDVLLKLWPS